MFDAIAAAVDWSAVYLALAEVAILLAGLWVALRGAKAILRFVLGSSGSGWDYSQGDPDWQTEEQEADVRWVSEDVAPAGGFEFIEAQPAGSTGTTLDPLDPDSPEYVGESWVDDDSGDDSWKKYL